MGGPPHRRCRAWPRGPWGTSLGAALCTALGLLAVLGPLRGPLAALQVMAAGPSSVAEVWMGVGNGRAVGVIPRLPATAQPDQSPLWGNPQGHRWRTGRFAAESRALLLRQAMETTVWSPKWLFNAFPLHALPSKHRAAPPLRDAAETADFAAAVASLGGAIQAAVPGLGLTHATFLLEAVVRLSLWDAVARDHFAQREEGRAAVDGLLQRILRPTKLATLSPERTSRVVWSIGRLGLRRDAVLQPLIDHLLRHPSTTAEHLSRALWGLVRAEFADFATYFAIAERLVPLLAPPLGPLSVSTVAWALASRGVGHEPLLTALANRILAPDFLPLCNAQHLADLAAAYARWGVRDDAVLGAIAAHAQQGRMPGSFSPRSLATLLWAYGRLGVADAGLLAALGPRVTRETFLAAADGHALATITEAYARLRVTDEAVLAAVASRVRQPAFLSALAPRDLAPLAASFAELGRRDVPLFNALADHILFGDLLPQFGGLELAGTLGAFAALRVPCRPLLAAATDLLLAGGRLQTLEAPEAATVAWALAILGDDADTGPLLPAMAEVMAERRLTPHLSGDKAVALVQACATQRLRHPPLLGALADRLSQRAVLPGLAPPQAVAVAAAYAALGVRQPHLLDRLALRLLQPEALAGLSPAELDTLLAVCRAADPPPAGLLEAAEAERQRVALSP